MWLKIKPETPLILGGVRADSQFLTTRYYIPGRVLRGAWAEDLIRRHKTDKEILALVNQVHIGNFFPTLDLPTVDWGLPLPMSAMTCKRRGGFLTEPGRREEHGHGVVDTLLPRLAYFLLKRNGVNALPPFLFKCAECGDRMESLSGFYTRYRKDNRLHHVTFHPRYHAQTKVALSRLRRASVEGMLYTASALSPVYVLPNAKEKQKKNLLFLGRVRGDKQVLRDLMLALNRTPIGALHTRGYGRIQVGEAEVNLPPLGERLEQFNERLGDLWRDLRRLATNAKDMPGKPDGTYFSIDLLAPGVFRDDGLPTLVPTLIIGERPLKPLLWLTRPTMASGWSTAWGLSKPTHLAARMGSTYAFYWDGDKQLLLEALETLEAESLGLRRDEGFGECLVCHPFHLEVQEK